MPRCWNPVRRFVLRKVVQSTFSRSPATACWKPEQFRKAGYTIVTTSSRAATPLFKATLPRKMVLVLGQERDGLSDAALSSADLSVSIDGTGNVESLNVSVATGVLLAEWWRQNKA